MKEAILVAITLSILLGIVTGCYTLSTSVGKSIELNARQEQAERQQAQLQQQRQFELEQRTIDPAWAEAKANVVTAAGVAGAMLVFVVAGAGSWWAVSEIQARRKHALLLANSIPLDRATRQYPLLPYLIAGRVHIYNPNTNSVIDTSQLTPGQPQMIAAQSLAQVAGLLAVAAQQAKSAGAPAAIAAINPPLIMPSAEE